MEIAHSLETDVYIMAMQGMVSSRGRPANIWSLYFQEIKNDIDAFGEKVNDCLESS